MRLVSLLPSATEIEGVGAIAAILHPGAVPQPAAGVIARLA